MRVVSLVPSATETLLGWGVVPVGVTRFCEQPQLPAVGGTKNPDVAAVVGLAPDVVVLCEEENRREDAEALAAAGLRLHVVRIESLASYDREMAALAAAVGLPAPPSWSPPAPVGRRIRAFVPIWRRPWMTLSARTYGGSLLDALGVDPVVGGSGPGGHGDADPRYPTVSLAQVAEMQTEVVLAPSEPYPFGERHRAELETVAPVRFVDGQDLFWWGARTPDAFARLEGVVATLR